MTIVIVGGVAVAVAIGPTYDRTSFISLINVSHLHIVDIIAIVTVLHLFLNIIDAKLAATANQYCVNEMKWEKKNGHIGVARTLWGYIVHSFV